ncbi:MAG: AarF/UbiB family protein [Actinomycetota bacterium]|nr:AarF/UbiB family protein [Actinomycetota bacterium]
MTPSNPPPLPDLRQLVAESDWVAGRHGLADAAATWQTRLPAVRRELAGEAAMLARPRLWIDTVSSLASTGWKVTSAAAPDAPFALLAAAATASGTPISPPRDSRGTVRRAERLVRAGGPAYIKLGQFISSARGLLPDEWVEAFGWCRDKAPTLPRSVVNKVLREHLGERHIELRDLDPEPLAAASIAQVHTAVLEDGTDVVVKLRRPGLRRQLRSDIETMALVAAVAERLHPGARMANLVGFVELFSQLVLEELDFRLEALNLVELGAAFENAGIDYCTLPRPIPGMVTEGVLVMERVAGFPYDKAGEALGARLDGDRLIKLAIQGVLETTLIYGLFHGDLHAGNVLIAGGDAFALVDFGICGRIDSHQRAALVSFMLAFAQMDARAQLAALTEFGALPAGADLDTLAAKLQVELDRINPETGQGLTYDQVGETLSTVMRMLSKSRFRLPTELVLFFKNVLYLTSFTASIAPDADLLGQIGPILGHFMAKYGDQLPMFFGNPEQPATVPA